MNSLRHSIILLLFYIPFLACSQNAFYTLGESYAKEGNYDEAIRLTKMSVEIDFYNSDKLDLFCDYDILCEYYSYLAEVDSCQVYAQKALQLCNQVEGLEYESILPGLSASLFRGGAYQQAIDLREELLNIKITKYGDNSPNIIGDYRLLSWYNQCAGNNILAVEYAKKEEELAYETRNIIDDREGRISYQESFLSLRSVIQVCDDPIAGIHYVLKILNEHRDAITDEDREHTLNSIWAISRDNDFLDGCLAVYKYYAMHGNYQEQLTNLINIDVEDNNISNDIHAAEYAQGLYDLVMNGDLSQRLSNDEIDTLLSLLPDYYSKIGLVRNSYEMAKKNYEWRKQNNLELYFSDVRVLISGSGFKDEVNYVVSLGEEMLRTHRYDGDELVLNIIHQNLAEAYLKIDDIVTAEKHLSQISNNNEYEALRSKALVYLEKGDMELLFPIALKLVDNKNVSELNREYDLWLLMVSARGLREKGTLVKKSKEYIDVYRELLLNNIPLMSEGEQTHFLQRRVFSSNLIYDFFIGIDGSQISWIAAKEAYDYALLKKGILLTSQNEFRNTLKRCPDPLIRNKWDSLQKHQGGYTLENEILKRELTKYVSQHGSYFEKLNYTWKDVRDVLKEDEVAIEFIYCYNFRDYGLDEIDPKYIALILKKDVEEPIPVILTSNLYSDSLSTLRILDYEDLSLYKQFWLPLEPYLNGIKTIYFSPIDELNSLPIEFASNGMVRANELWNLVRVSSTREIISYERMNKKERAVLYGGLKYEMDKESLVAESRSGNYHSVSTTRTLPIESLRYGVKDLPESLTEVNNIASLFTGRPTLITGESGTEESFKALGNSNYDIIHLATHGFFWSNEDANKRGYVNFLNNSNLQELTTEENAMLRSGLVFSGANIGLMGETLPEDVEDGVLTAKELSTMNLGNVDMVVMSACESGLGEVSGEGVFGLQRGFKLAGANTLLMSLWKVDDKATQILMTEFYRNYLSGKSKQESLRLAQQYLRNYNDGGNDYSDPEYWAAFILLDGLD